MDWSREDMRALMVEVVKDGVREALGERSKEVKRSGAADGSRVLIAPGASTELGPGDEVVEPRLTWRGSVTDLVTDIAAVLTLPQLQELAGEVAIAWRKRVREEKE